MLSDLVGDAFESAAGGSVEDLLEVPSEVTPSTVLSGPDVGDLVRSASMRSSKVWIAMAVE